MDGDPGLAWVPEAHRVAAEQVVAHLTSLRGAGIFLSAADALRLVQWLDSGVGVTDILRAIERAAARRRSRRSRVPLSLGQASRHLGRPTAGALAGAEPADAGANGLGPLVALVRSRQADDPRHAELGALADLLTSLPAGGPDAVAAAAIAAIRRFQDDVWEGASPDERARERTRAHAGLADLAPHLDERTVTVLVEEAARDAVRERYRWLSAATVWDVVGPAEEP